MTVVKSAWATGHQIIVEDCKVDPDVNVTVVLVRDGARKLQATVNRADLIAAVRQRRDVATIVETRIEYWQGRAIKAEGLVGIERKYKEKAIDRAYEAEAKYDLLEAAMETLRDLVVGGEANLDVVRSVLENCLGKAEPEFELPTKTWAGIVAEHHELGELELRLFPDGKWTNVQGESPFTRFRRWDPDAVLTCFTGHRVVED